ncbi:MAG: signal peptidase I [Planctomycetes bacterium RBG_13_46_10]|nr:MAG: signal peptidase I [Planctomycetes bacterium RBG_13_46_10]
MSVDRSNKISSGEAAQKKKDIAVEIANTFEWLITAFILAFVFRAFIMEAFRIPTGSMADTLKGAHFRLCCEQCGYNYSHGFTPEAYIFCPHCGYICGFNLVREKNMRCPQCMNIYTYPERYRLKQDTIPARSVDLPHTRCPSCSYERGYDRFSRRKMPVANGDRILVLKCIYQFVEPKRWDVIVFKNPLDPTENYIKRLIGLPGEKIEIIDGDIYVDGRIQRKPPKVQNELWTVVYDHDYQPIRPMEGTFAGHPWWRPLSNDSDSMWLIDDQDNPTLAHLAGDTEQINTLVYQTPGGKDFKAGYSYNDVDPRREDDMPECSDLMVRFYAESDIAAGRPVDSQRSIGITLRKYQTSYSAWVNSKNEMVIAKVGQDKQLVELKRKQILSMNVNKPMLVKFANIDHQLIFEFGREKLTYDLGSGPNDIGPRETGTEPRVKIFGAGRLTLSHIAIFRDIHYTSEKTASGKDLGRATEGNPFTLAKDEFFVLGDNSPNSEDGRWWSTRGVANNGLYYRPGIVPRDYLVGKALFVYWPSGFEFPWPENVKTYLLSRSRQNSLMRIANGATSLRWIPNVGQMRFIYGGSNKEPEDKYGGE